MTEFQMFLSLAVLIVVLKIIEYKYNEYRINKTPTIVRNCVVLNQGSKSIDIPLAKLDKTIKDLTYINEMYKKDVQK